MFKKLFFWRNVEPVYERVVFSASGMRTIDNSKFNVYAVIVENQHGKRYIKVGHDYSGYIDDYTLTDSMFTKPEQSVITGKAHTNRVNYLLKKTAELEKRNPIKLLCYDDSAWSLDDYILNFSPELHTLTEYPEDKFDE